LGAATGTSSIYSDKRLKANINTISNALYKLDQIRGVSFDYTAPAAVRDQMAEPAALPEDGTRSIGVLAQEIEVVLPELVSTDAQGYKSVEYANLAGFLIQVNKEQEAEIKQMKLVIAVLAVATMTTLTLGIALFCWVKRRLEQKLVHGECKAMEGPLL
jgi:hypothetical protein